MSHRIQLIKQWAVDHPSFDTTFVDSVEDCMYQHDGITTRQSNALDNIIARWRIVDHTLDAGTTTSKRRTNRSAAFRKGHSTNNYKSVHIEAEDGDVVFIKEQLQYKCPLTLTTFVSPVQSVLCGHIYSKTAVLQHIKIAKNGGAEPSCPVAGCRHLLSKGALEDTIVPTLQVQQAQGSADVHDLT
jgi:SUMO ligase MMS21 Smc5/6 complex component